MADKADKDRPRAPYYGLHADGRVTWLVQGSSGSNFIGLKGQCPFDPPKGIVCNHRIPTAAPLPAEPQWNLFRTLAENNPLIQAALPIPQPLENRVHLVQEDPNSLLVLLALSRLSSPINNIIHPHWLLNKARLRQEMTATNVQPLILTGFTSTDQTRLTNIASTAVGAPRTVICVGDSTLGLRGAMRRSQLPPQEHLEDLIRLPLESLGAFMMRRYCRGEDIFSRLESRDERRSRMQNERTPAKPA